MFVKKFLERKPVRTAVKKWIQGDKNHIIGNYNREFDSANDFLWQQLGSPNVVNRTFFLANKNTQLNCLEIYVYNEIIPSGTIPNDLPSGPKWRLNLYDTSNMEGILQYQLMWLIEDGNSMLLQMDIDNTFAFIADNKRRQILLLEQVRIAFKRLFYDRISQVNAQISADLPHNHLLFLYIDISNIYDLLEVTQNQLPIDWTRLGTEQYPGWYDNLPQQAKELFPDSMISDTTMSQTLNVLDNSYSWETGINYLRTFFSLSNHNDVMDSFVSEYFEFFMGTRVLTYCNGIDIDHTTCYRYRPFMDGLYYTNEYLVWYDLSAILVYYATDSENNENNLISVPQFMKKIRNAEFPERFTTVDPRYISMDMSKLQGQYDKAYQWIQRLIDFFSSDYQSALSIYLRTGTDALGDPNVNADTRRIMNLTCEDLNQFHETIHKYEEDSENPEYPKRGILHWIDDCLEATYENPYVETGGLLIRNGELTQHWKTIYDSLNAIVIEDEMSVLRAYPEIDFETLLQEENAEEDIAEAIWAPWKAIQQIVDGETVVSSISELIKDSQISYEYVYDTLASFRMKFTLSNTTFNYQPNIDQWERETEDTRIIDGMLPEVLKEFYAKYLHFNPSELKCLFYQLKLWNWNYSHLTGLYGDLVAWTSFLTVNITTNSLEMVNGTTAVTEEIRKNYELPQLEDSDALPAHNDYECIDPYENVSHLENYFMTQSDSTTLDKFKLANCFIRTFGKRLPNMNSGKMLYDYGSRFTTSITHTYDMDYTPEEYVDGMKPNNQLYAIIDKRYSATPVPDFVMWLWPDIKNKEIYPSYLSISSEETIDTNQYPYSFYTYQVGRMLDGNFTIYLELPLYNMEKKRLTYVDPEINFETDNHETIREKFLTWIRTCNNQEITMAVTVHEQLIRISESKMFTSDYVPEDSLNPENILCYSVDSYLDKDIDILLDNILADTEEKGVYAYDNAIFAYIDTHRTALEEAFNVAPYNGKIPTGGRCWYDVSTLKRKLPEGLNIESKVSDIRQELHTEGEDDTETVEVRYYPNIEGKFGKANERYQKWGEFKYIDSTGEYHYGNAFNGEYEKFYEYAINLGEPNPEPDPEPQPSGVQISAEMLDESEYEIYECDQIYETFILNEKVLNVAPTSGKANEYLDMIINIPAVKALLDKVYVPKPAPATYMVSDVCLYKNPIYQTGNNEANANAILEYGQFLATIQSRRNLICALSCRIFLLVSKASASSVLRLPCLGILC